MSGPEMRPFALGSLETGMTGVGPRDLQPSPLRQAGTAAVDWMRKLLWGDQPSLLELMQAHAARQAGYGHDVQAALNDPMLQQMGQEIAGNFNLVGGLKATPGIALDMSQTARMARAAEQGFTQPAWHGSRNLSDITYLEPSPAKRPLAGHADYGIHLAMDPATAYNAIVPEGVRKTTSPETLMEYRQGAGTLPVRVNPGKSVVLPDFGRWDHPNNAMVKYFEPKTDYGDVIDRYRESSGWEHTDYGRTYLPKPSALEQTSDPAVLNDLGKLAAEIDRKKSLWSKRLREFSDSSGEPRIDSFKKGDSFDYPAFNAARGNWLANKYEPWQEANPKPDEYHLWQSGFSKVLSKHGYDSVLYPNNIEGHGEMSMMLVDPARVRSVHAKFDPAKMGSKDLLAGLAAGGIALGAAASQEQQP